MVTVRPATGGGPPNSFRPTTPEKLENQKNLEDAEEFEEKQIEAGTSKKFRVYVTAFLLIYTLFGAWIFQLLELGPELETMRIRRNIITSGRLRLFKAMENLTGESMDSEAFQNNENWKGALEAVHEYETDINYVLDGNLRVYLSDHEELNLKWGSFLQSYFFVLILITTIGYGNLAPTTTWGRIFCVNYALIGIPVMLIFIAQTGKQLARFATSVYLKLFGDRSGWRYFTNHGDSSYVQKMIGTSASITTVVIVLFCYMAIGAVIFDAREQWGFINSFYFCFISLTTVGFGDLVPAPSSPENSLGPLVIIARTVYSLWGLAITATAIQLVQNHYEEIWIKAEVRRNLHERGSKSGSKNKKAPQARCAILTPPSN